MYYRKSIISACLTLFVVLLSMQALAAEVAKSPIVRGDPVAGKNKAAGCFGCHGADGNSMVAQFPKLAGQYEVYISKQMRDYRDNKRTHELMGSLAANLNAQDMADISAYYAQQPKMKGSGSTPNLQGKKIYLQGNISAGVMTCAYCHGNTGKGLTPETGMYPVIGGQHKEYLLKQLIDFRASDRHNSPNVVMNKTLKTLSNAELEALAEYISSL